MVLKVYVKTYLSSLRLARPGLDRLQRQKIEQLGLRLSRFPFPRLCIPSEKLVDHLAIPYGADTHYHNRALASKNGSKALNDYFYSFQPATLADIFGEPSLARFPSWYFANRMPWSTNHRVVTAAAAQPPRRIAHFGPADEEFIDTEWGRLVSAYQSIARKGYRPWLFPDGFIQGFLIADQLRYVFVVTTGKHRAATVSRRQRFVDVRLDANGFLPIVRADELDALPQVASGMYSRKEAEILIDRYLQCAS